MRCLLSVVVYHEFGLLGFCKVACWRYDVPIYKCIACSPFVTSAVLQVGFLDAMRFKGSAPEIVNCRLAMLGFVAAVAAGGFLNDHRG